MNASTQAENEGSGNTTRGGVLRDRWRRLVANVHSAAGQHHSFRIAAGWEQRLVARTGPVPSGMDGAGLPAFARHRQIPSLPPRESAPRALRKGKQLETW